MGIEDKLSVQSAITPEGHHFATMLTVKTDTESCSEYLSEVEVLAVIEALIQSLERSINTNKDDVWVDVFADSYLRRVGRTVPVR